LWHGHVTLARPHTVTLNYQSTVGWGQARYYLPLLDTHLTVQIDRKIKVFLK